MRTTLFGLGFLTFLALGYVQQRITLVGLGYEVEKLRQTHEELLDQHRVLQYNVLTLCSPVILSQRLARREVKLTPPSVVEQLPRQRVSHPTPQTAQAVKMPSSGQPLVWGWLMRLLGSGRQAQAEPGSY